MSLIETKTDYAAAESVGAAASRLNIDFIENILGAGHEFFKDDDGVYWLDENHSCGMKFVPSPSGASSFNINLYSGVGSSESLNTGITYSYAITCYSQFSKNKDVFYFLIKRSGTSSSGRDAIICAKDSGGRWAIFHGGKMYCTEGIFSLDFGVSVVSGMPFSFVKIPPFFGNRSFENLYMVRSAPIYKSPASSNYEPIYVNAGGGILRVVSGSSSDSSVPTSNLKPSFAFPVSAD